MKIRELNYFRGAAGIASVFLICAAPVFGAEKGTNSSSAEQAIRSSAKDFEVAFNKGDAAALAAQWTPDGRLVDESGEVLKGRKAIEDAYTTFFKQRKSAKIEIAVTGIDFPADGVAIEEGVSTSTAKGELRPSVGTYMAVHTLQDGKWLMASVNEAAAPSPADRVSLNDLNDLIGTWEVKKDKTVVRSKVSWMPNKKFIQRDYTVQADGATQSSGMQIIGWDPSIGKIRSWSFDSTGGHGMAIWEPSPQGWALDSSGTLADGTVVTSLDFLVRVAGENDVLGYKSVNRKANGRSLPDTKEVVLDRVKEK